MDAATYVATLTERGVRLWVTPEGGLGYEAPKGTVTPKVRQSLIDGKPRIIAYLRSVVADPVPDPPRRRTEADIQKPKPKEVQPESLDVPDELPDIEPDTAPSTEPSFITAMLDSDQARSNNAWRSTMHPDYYRFLMWCMYQAATFGVLPTLPDDAALALRPGETVTNLSGYVRRSVERSRDIRGKLQHPRLSSQSRENFLDDLTLISLGLDTVAAHLSDWKPRTM